MDPVVAYIPSTYIVGPSNEVPNVAVWALMRL